MLNYKRREDLCSVCGKIGPVKKCNKKDGTICIKCYKKPKSICSNCGKIDVVKKITTDGKSICPECSKEKCFICGKVKLVAYRQDGNPVCRECHKERCFLCNKIKPVKTRDVKGNPICFNCYTQPEEKCFICGILKIVSKRDENRNPICRDCNKSVCYICNKTKLSYKIGEYGHICKNCYTKIRKERDDQFKIMILLRIRLKSAIDRYAKLGKIQSASKYGINYKNIIEYIGPKPDDDNEYHIDHIFPLSAFDLNNCNHIRAAFAPENHRWLLKKENLSKNTKYNKDEFQNYLNKFIEEIE